MKVTFNQIAALIICLCCITILSLMHFKVVNPNDASEDSIKALLGIAGFFLFGSTAGSQSKDKSISDNHSELVDALKNSTPVSAISTVDIATPVLDTSIPIINKSVQNEG